ncbi:MAG TPA: hypothetical protein VFA82_08325 [Gaiellaceae bacterium]|nr:hypothetical protein [Gaiellaceae bacterium]
MLGRLTRPVPASALALAGVFAIALFATIGQFAHHGHAVLGAYAADVLPLAGCFAALALLTHRFLPTWLGGVTAGVAIRMAILGHERLGELSFLAVALVFVGAVSFALVVLMTGREPLEQLRED